ncbi:hypothetical protein [Burkholderia stagnalis]|uniref:hypothetical protein n=1 Tax=Burkholderia stagnalis TaxID=1503054 RepID=UPI000F55B337|nr:hypothetical protein [Burkholderia stagnalis]
MQNVAIGCDWIAQQWGWQLARANVMVEGESDVRYFRLASDLNADATGFKLISGDLSIFAAGQGNDGGTYGIAERFPTLHNIACLDLDLQTQKRRYRVIALVDDDAMGKRVVSGIQAGNRSIIEYEHLFRLRRIMPRRAGSTAKLKEHTLSSNRGFSDLECVIEDLLPLALCTEYASSFPHHQLLKPKICASGHHAKWTEDGKRGLLKYAQQHATVADLALVIDVLKSLRSYLGLPPDGEPR